MKNNKLKNISLDDYSFGILLTVIFLLPLFFIPILGISIDYAKNFLLQVLVFASLILWLIARMKNGNIEFPKTPLLLFVFLIPLLFLVSSLNSTARAVSLFGFGYEIDTFVSVLVLFLAMFLSSIHFQKINRIIYAYYAVLVSAGVLGLYYILRFILGLNFLSFDIFTSLSSGMIGKWNDLSIFFVLVFIISLSALHILQLNKIPKIIFYLASALSLFFIAVINFTLAWVFTGIFSLIIFVYILSFYGDGEDKSSDDKDFKFKLNKILILPIGIFLVSVIFLIPGNPTGNFLSQKLGISTIEARPSWSATNEIVKNTIKSNAILGVGPNRFIEQWIKFKPDVINRTIFWRSNFEFGVGIIPSFAVTTGIVGLLLWILFFVWFMFKGGVSIFAKDKDKFSRYLIFSSFFSSMYLWAISVFYVPGILIFASAFFFTGIFIAILTNRGYIKNVSFSFIKSPKVGFISILIITVLIIGGAVSEYFFIQKFSSVYFWNKGIKYLNVNGDIGSAESYVKKATRLYKSDVYYRTLTDIQIFKIGKVLSQKDIGKDELRLKFQAALNEAVSVAQKSITFDNTNFLNWLSLGKVYTAVIPLGVDGAYKNAISSYKKALLFNPNNPEIYLMLARVEISNKDSSKAKKYIEDAIKLKNNYTEAILLLSKIQANEGSLRVAISTLEKALAASPNDIGIFFQLGFLRYQNKDYNDAIQAFERAVALQPAYSNAKYFLGLSYLKIGRKTDAITQFKDVEKLNPGNAEIKKVLDNITNKKTSVVNSTKSIPRKEKDNSPIKQ